MVVERALTPLHVGEVGTSEMKCEKCEKELAGGAVICRACGFNNALQRVGGWRARRELSGEGRASRPATRRAKDATLIPFPISPSKAPAPETAHDTVGVFPPWRDQLSEKLRQIRERRNLESGELAGSPPAPERNPIVEAAVNRLRNATQSAPSGPSRSLRQGAQATAHAIDYEEAPEPVVKSKLAPLPRHESTPHASSIGVGAAPAKNLTSLPDWGEAQTMGPAMKPASIISPAATSEPEGQTGSLRATSRPQPADPATLPGASKFTTRGSAPLLARAAASVIDLEIIAFSYLPFFTAYTILNAELSRGSLYVLGGIAAGITFIYHLLTVATAGRTCGMAALKLRVVDAASESFPPTLAQAFGRALGGTVSMILFPFNLLVIWLSLDRYSLSDFLSGTVIVRQ